MEIGLSIKIMSLVWSNYPVGGSYKLVMLALADWSDDHGQRIYPSNQAVSEKCCISKSQAVRILRDLTDDGYLELLGNKFGGKPGTTKQYRMVLDRLTGSAHATGVIDATGSTHAPTRVAPMRQTGSAHATQTTSEPSSEPPKSTEKKLGAALGYSEEFEQAWKDYPRRPGENKKNAFKAWSARIKAGALAEDMHTGARAYAAYCKALQTAANFIKQPETFFGPSEHYLANWTPPTNGANHGNSKHDHLKRAADQLFGRNHDDERVIEGETIALDRTPLRSLGGDVRAAICLDVGEHEH